MPPPLRRFRPVRRARVGARRLRAWYAALEVALARRFGLASSEDRRFFLLIAAVGVAGGLLAILLQVLLDLLRRVLWGGGGTPFALAAHAPLWRLIAAPAIGGLLVGILILLGRQPVSGQGTALLIESVVLRQGVVPTKPVLLSAAASVFTVGSGGSLGKEGPLVRLGAMLGSWLGQHAGLGARRVKILLACGAAAGMAATYNVPIGGSLWAMEVILGNFALEIFGPIVVASVLATLLARFALGDVPLYAATQYQLQNGWELIPYLGLGVLGAFAAVAFVWGVRGGKAIFGHLPFLPPWTKPIVGLALVGALAREYPHVIGNGFEGITAALRGQLPLGLLLVLPAAKILAGALTSGSGGAGGTFTPSLFVGAMVGGAYGMLVHAVWPFATSPYGAYAAVGMAAIAAGTSHAPISAILILFELTGNYQLILPLMVAAITASFLSRSLYRYSMEEESLRQRGVDLSFRLEEAAFAGIEVKSLLRADHELLRAGDRWAAVVERFLATNRKRLFVVDAQGRLEGGIALHDIKALLQEPAESLQAVVAHDLASPVERVLHPDTRLHRVVEAFAASDYERLPVVERDTGKLTGLIAKKDLLAIYSQEVLGRPAMLATFVSGDASRDYVELPKDFALKLLAVPKGMAGRTLKEINLTQRWGVRVLEVQRRRNGGPTERIVPGADTALRDADTLVVIGPLASLEKLEQGTHGADEALAHAGIN